MSRLRRAGAKRVLPVFEKLGFHLTACDFEDPIPTLSELKDELWNRESACLGIEMNESGKLRLLHDVCAPFKAEYDGFGLREPRGDCAYFVYNGSFGEIDGDVLYCIIRSFKPRRIVEVGAGWSTLLSAHALRRNAAESGTVAELIAIEPHPRSFLRQDGAGITRLVEKQVQDVEPKVFESLEAHDILFVDSSHVVRIGGDAIHEILEILPRLQRGVLVHFHDIFLPFEYPKRWVTNLRTFYTEMYLLRAFLMFNASFEVIWAGNWMKTRHPEAMKRLFRSQASQSFWIRRTA